MTSSGDKTIRVHARTGKNLSDWVCCAILEGHTASVCGCTAALDDQGVLTIASASLDKTARLWTSPVAFGELLQQRIKGAQATTDWAVTVLADAAVTPHGGDQRLLFCPCDEALLAVTTGKDVQVWERWETEGHGGGDASAGAAAKWERSATLSGLDGYVNSISFREDGLLLAAVDHQGNVKVLPPPCAALLRLQHMWIFKEGSAPRVGFCQQSGGAARRNAFPRFCVGRNRVMRCCVLIIASRVQERASALARQPTQDSGWTRARMAAHAGDSVLLWRMFCCRMLSLCSAGTCSRSVLLPHLLPRLLCDTGVEPRRRGWCS